jgi:UDP-glucose 4-epimerase
MWFAARRAYNRRGVARILVTGGAGFIGSHLVDALVERGDQVCVLDDLSSGSASNLDRSHEQIRFESGSVLDSALVGSLTAGCDAIVHLAAVSSVPASILEPARSEDVNVNGTEIVVQAARQMGARLVFASSSAVYGNASARLLSEEMVPEPESPYAMQKLLGERAVGELGISQRLCGGRASVPFESERRSAAGYFW